MKLDKNFGKSFEVCCIKFKQGRRLRQRQGHSRGSWLQEQKPSAAGPVTIGIGGLL